MPSRDPLAAAQDDLFVRLVTRNQLRAAGVFVQVMRPRTQAEATSIIDGINQTLLGTSGDRGRAGLAILIPLPAFETKRPNVPGVVGEMILRAVVMENIMINEGDQGTRMTCEAAAILTMIAGQHFQLGDNRCLYCDGMVPLNVDDQEFQADVAYEVTFRAQGGFAQEGQCAIPLITISGAVTSITCATSGARVLMTLDGSMPWDGNPAAVPVDASFETPEPGTVIRAVAYHDNDALNPSSAAWAVAP